VINYTYNADGVRIGKSGAKTAAYTVCGTQILARIIYISKLNVTFIFKFYSRAMHNAFNRTYKTEDLFISEIIQ